MQTCEVELAEANKPTSVIFKGF